VIKLFRISQIKLPITHGESELYSAVAATAKVKPADILQLNIIKQSIDARDKNNICYVYTVDVMFSHTPKNLFKNKKISKTPTAGYVFPHSGKAFLEHPPVIVGSGPAGLFCGLFLARAGYNPIIIERGEPANKRIETVNRFWQEGILNPCSNVQFGEGGAGTFSDGKLNTMVKDKFHRNKKVLETFVEHGAYKDILYVAKPHLGTDKLVEIVTSIRKEIESLGGQVHFNTLMKDIIFEHNEVRGIITETGGKSEEIPCEVLVLACGHSARDTFYMLNDKEVSMEAKAFAVGLRIMHPAKMINEAQYGPEGAKLLPTAPYKVTARSASKRGVYSFCMCPGGYVVNASSEDKMLAVNGMSYSDRGGDVSNSAIIVTVSPMDYGTDSVLSGVEYQRNLEKKAYKLCAGKVPVQLFGDFAANRISKEFGEFKPAIKGEYDFGNLREIFDEEISLSIIDGMKEFNKQIRDFARNDAIFAGVESRTSSPVRIIRGEDFQSNKKGLYPCGEGAGYAGGITSAAMDGIKVAESIAKRFKPF